ncbi:hypothetical protein [Agitococcus lubricus]|uniref:Uncharacterized protein n=1 Tax=Agitococcus lubricus TaxID=1077255 RepID=A0A2T5J2Q8_9GAMM|nr:hypothetical protein [Agitococcus lubricus]PTQ90808.1 hypothetical protein C8N29_102208 [Agitococcus lubricus]
MRHFFIFLITLYQKYISPYKGFRCAYAEFTRRATTSALSEAQMTLGHLSSERISDNSVNDKKNYHDSLSCSAIIKNIIAEQGLFAGWPLIKQQFNNCHLAYLALETEREKKERERRERRLRREPCFSKKDKCDCGLNSLDCLPDLPCDANPCNYYTFKKSIHQKRQHPHKYDIRE